MVWPNRGECNARPRAPRGAEVGGAGAGGADGGATAASPKLRRMVRPSTPSPSGEAARGPATRSVSGAARGGSSCVSPAVKPAPGDAVASIGGSVGAGVRSAPGAGAAAGSENIGGGGGIVGGAASSSGKLRCESAMPANGVRPPACTYVGDACGCAAAGALRGLGRTSSSWSASKMRVLAGSNVVRCWCATGSVSPLSRSTSLLPLVLRAGTSAREGPKAPGVAAPRGRSARAAAPAQVLQDVEAALDDDGRVLLAEPRACHGQEAA